MNQRIWVVVTMILCLCGSNAFAQNSFVQLTKAKRDMLKEQANSLNQEIEKIGRQVDKMEGARKDKIERARKSMNRRSAMKSRLSVLDDRIFDFHLHYSIDFHGVWLAYCEPLGIYWPARRDVDPKLFKGLDRIQARADAKILSQCGSGEMNEAAKRTADRIQAQANAEKKRLIEAKYPVAKHMKKLEAERVALRASITKLESEINASTGGLIDYIVAGTTHVDALGHFDDYAPSLDDYFSSLDDEADHLNAAKSALQATLSEVLKKLSRVQEELSNISFDEKYGKYDLLHTTVPLKNGSKVHVYLIPPKYVKVPVEKLNGITKNHMLPIQDGKNRLAIRPNFLFKGQKYYVVYSSQELTVLSGLTTDLEIEQEIKKQNIDVLDRIGGDDPVYEYGRNYFKDRMMYLCKYNSRGEFLYVIGKKDVIDLIRKKGRRVR